MGLLLLCALFLLGDLGWSLRERAVQELFKAQLLQFSQNATLLNILIGAVPAVLALILGPLVGAWSDRTHTRYGRRIPFVFGTTLVSAAAMAGLAFSRSLTGLAISWTIFEMATLVGNPLFVALINDSLPRAILGRFFGLFRIVSLATGACFFALFFGNDLAVMFRPLLLAISLTYLACMLFVCWRMREQDAGPAAAPPLPQVGGAGSWARLFAAVALAAVAVLPININALNASAQFGVDAASFGQAIALAYAISIVLAWPLGWLADRFHPLRVGGVVLCLYMLATLLAWRGVDGRASFLLAFVVHGVLAGAFLTGTASLLPALLPRERFSQLAAVSASVTALLTVVATLGLGALLDATGRDYRLLYLAGAMVSGMGGLAWRGLLRRHAPAAAPQS